jgi:hypothetical protein
MCCIIIFIFGWFLHNKYIPLRILLVYCAVFFSKMLFVLCVVCSTNGADLSTVLFGGILELAD